jgi:hypothetical protein
MHSPKKKSDQTELVQYVAVQCSHPGWLLAQKMKTRAKNSVDGIPWVLAIVEEEWCLLYNLL